MVGVHLIHHGGCGVAGKVAQAVGGVGDLRAKPHRQACAVGEGQRCGHVRVIQAVGAVCVWRRDGPCRLHL